MVVTDELKEAARVTVPVALNTLGVNVFTAPGKTMVGERPKPFGEALGFDPITRSQARPTLPRRSRTPSVTSRTSIGCRKPRRRTRRCFDQMTELYPHWVANQSWLMFGFPGG
jgi:hypothetical protein